MPVRRRGHMSAAAFAFVLVLGSGCTTSREGGSDSEETAAPGLRDQIGAIVDDVVVNDPGGAYRDARAFLVSVDGTVVFERYWHQKPTAPSNTWSVTKSVLSLLVGIAIAEGHIDGVDTAVGVLLPEHAPRMTVAMRDTTLRRLLTMTAGLPAVGSMGADSFHASADWVSQLVQTRLNDGGEFAYSNESSHLVAAILAEATGVSVLEYARSRLFAPLGIDTEPAAEPVASAAILHTYDDHGFAWPVDPQGVHLGHLGLTLAPHDMWKIGQLVLDGGRWEGRQVVPADWVRASTGLGTKADRDAVPNGPENAPGYGFFWWIDPAGPHEAALAQGSGGQLIDVVPELGLVVVVLSTTDRGISPLEGAAYHDLVESLIVPLLEDG